MDHDGLGPVLDPEMQQELGLVDARDDALSAAGHLAELAMTTNDAHLPVLKQQAEEIQRLKDEISAFQHENDF